MALGELGLHRVGAAVMPANLGSARVLKKCGFREEGFAHKVPLHKGSLEDHLLFARTVDSDHGAQVRRQLPPAEIAHLVLRLEAGRL